MTFDLASINAPLIRTDYTCGGLRSTFASLRTVPAIAAIGNGKSSLACALIPGRSPSTTPMNATSDSPGDTGSWRLKPYEIEGHQVPAGAPAKAQEAVPAGAHATTTLVTHPIPTEVLAVEATSIPVEMTPMDYGVFRVMPLHILSRENCTATPTK